MSDKKNSKNRITVLQVLKNLLFLDISKTDAEIKNKKKRPADEIKNRVLLKIERAEIMTAMVAMREGKDEE